MQYASILCPFVRLVVSGSLIFCIDFQQDNIRVAAGGCIGSLALIVPDTELEYIINDHLIGASTIIVAWVKFKTITE